MGGLLLKQMLIEAQSEGDFDFINSIKGISAAHFGVGVVWANCSCVVFKTSGSVVEHREEFVPHRGISRKWQPGDTVGVEVTVLGGRHSPCVGDDFEISFHFNGDEVWRKKGHIHTQNRRLT